MQISELDRIIKETWKIDISSDLQNGYILNEDTMKNAFYFHLRHKMEPQEEYKDFRIFTECTDFGFADERFRPDLIVGKISSNESGTDFITIKKIVAVFEFKYLNDKCTYVIDNVYRDFEKMRNYQNKLEFLSRNCQFYVASITRGKFTRENWLDGRSSWANGSVTELNAYDKDEGLVFEIYSHNKMNEDLNVK